MADQPKGEIEILARLLAPLAGAESHGIATRLLSVFGSLSKLLAAEEAELLLVTGNRADLTCKIRLLGELVRQTVWGGPSRRIRLSSPESVLEHVAQEMLTLRVETLRVLFLDAANHLIADVTPIGCR